MRTTLRNFLTGATKIKGNDLRDQGSSSIKLNYQFINTEQKHKTKRPEPKKLITDLYILGYNLRNSQILFLRVR